MAAKRKKPRKKRESSPAEAPAAEGRPSSASMGRSSRRFLILIGITLAIATILVMTRSSQPAGTVQVWSEEHGHYHDVPASEVEAASSADAGESSLDEAPLERDPTEANLPGLGKPGQVWSEEHGHWHDPQ